MKLIDVHAHLEGEKFSGDLDSVIDRFKEAGGEVVINSGVNPETNRQSLELSEKYDIVRASFGMYPVDAIADRFSDFGEEGYLRHVEAYDVDEELKWIEEHKDKCVAIGEIGLDFKVVENTTNEMKAAQEEVFRKIVKLAKRIGKPVVIHSRGAELKCVEILEELSQLDSKHQTGQGKLKVVMHCFCGRKSLVKRCVENGWFFSLAPAIKRWQNFQMIADIVPLGQLLTETDSPFLSHVARERNEPANVRVAVEEIARIRGVSVKEVAEQIFNNAERLFGL